MAVRSSTVNMSSGSNAGLRSWAGAIEDLFNASGWLQSTDTGQTAAASLVTTVVAGTVYGYQIWHMNDTLQATVPVFVKLEFGSSPTWGGNYGLWISIGTGSDGIGNITGDLAGRIAMNASSANSAATSTPFKGSGDANRIVLSCGSGSINYGRFMVSIERSKANDGTDSSDGVFLFLDAGSGTGGATLPLRLAQYRFLRFVDNTLANSTTTGTICPTASSWTGRGSTVGVCPMRYFGGGPSNPGTNLVTYISGDTGAGVSVPVSLYGIVKTYMPLGSGVVGTVVPGITNSTLMIRWE